MVVNGRIADSSFLATPAFKIKVRKQLMEPGPGMTTIVGGRRVKLASVATPNVRGTTTTTTTLIPTAQQTAHQKARRIIDEHAEWQERENQRPIKCSSSSPCIVSNYSIVASRGELSRNSFAVCETPAPTAKRKATISNGRVHREETPKSVLVKKQPGRKENDKEPIKSSKNSKRAIEKSASVPANLKEVTREKQSTKGVPEEGILKRSSAFLTSLTQSCGRNFAVVNKSSSCDNLGKSRKFAASNGSLYQESERSKGALTSVDSGKGIALARSPSFQTLQTSWRKPSRVLVKKSVSFSKDTSFEAKRLSHRKTAIHEAKVYRKGVLQDRGNCRESSRAVAPAACESPSWDPKVFLRAAREVDEFTLRKIIDSSRHSRLNGMDINAVDGSGRTAISYMAGNGAMTMLEAALSFPGLDPNLPDNEGNTPLHFAAQAGQTECLNILLQRCPGIEVDARNALGFTPLMKAALQGRTKCAKILLFAGANPTLRDHGRGLRAEQWARFCGRYVCADVIERFARHRLLERTTSCRWGSEPELAAKVLQGKVTPIPTNIPPPSTGLRSKIRRVFRTTSGPDRSFSLVSQLTSAALCASSPALPKPEDIPPVVKSLLRPLSVPQLRVTLVAPSEIIERTTEKCGTNFTEKIASEKTENAVVKPPRTKKKNK